MWVERSQGPFEQNIYLEEFEIDDLDNLKYCNECEIPYIVGKNENRVIEEFRMENNGIIVIAEDEEELGTIERTCSEGGNTEREGGVHV